MSRLDVVIFGATGFTGKYTVLEAVRLSKTNKFSWGVAGRSESKLSAMLREIGDKCGEDLSKIKKIVADVNDEQSLDEMCAQTKVLVNTCGPFRLYGEPVVRACVRARTHHLDVSGEPEYMESIQYKYDGPAREAGVYVISACGFDSIPNDLGVVYLQQHFPGVVNSVESYVSTYIPPEYRWSCTLHYGTWESLVLGLSNWGNLKELRDKLYPKPMPTLEPKLKPRAVVHNRDNKWCVPFPGADSSVVYRTQRYRHDTCRVRPVQFRPYLRIGSLLSALALIYAALVIYTLAKIRFTRNLLLKYPGFFSMGTASRAGPRENVMRSTKFKFRLHASGWATTEIEPGHPPDCTLTATVSGTNPGYGATCTALLVSALTILTDASRMPAPGVLTTGAAFYNTDIIQRLHDNNLLFQIQNN